jgi:hypothetical protein
MLAYRDVVASSVLLTAKNSKVTNPGNKCHYNRIGKSKFRIWAEAPFTAVGLYYKQIKIAIGLCLTRLHISVVSYLLCGTE